MKIITLSSKLQLMGSNLFKSLLVKSLQMHVCVLTGSGLTVN